jgi:hypothetical protein
VQSVDLTGKAEGVQALGLHPTDTPQLGGNFIYYMI